MASVSQKIVDMNLDAAIKNGYTEILTWPAGDLVLDLMAWSEDCQDSTEQELLPLIENWLSRRNKGLDIP